MAKTFEPNDWRAQSQDVLDRFGWHSHFDRADGKPVVGAGHYFWDHTLQHTFAGLWGRPNLSERDRELVMLGQIAAIGGQGIMPHLKNSWYVGNTARQVMEVFAMTGAYFHLDKAAAAAEQFQGVLAEPNSPYKTMKVPAPSGTAKFEDLKWDEPGSPEAKAFRTRCGDVAWEIQARNLRPSGHADGLSLRDRMIVALGLTMAAHASPFLIPLYENAARVGVNDNEIMEVILTGAHYAGWPKAGTCVALLREVREPGSSKV